ncbi:endothelin-converting enzyme 1-like [Dermacentor silvarum]|uniref:endothelin-converting enzyme 1-like n=1 Tax=Dermacentor silvarum TaxID=543639 RepID=UPI002100B049|nr:endothelin-converting enzyme 1-like [Dermacentor silvarum]
MLAFLRRSQQVLKPPEAAEPSDVVSQGSPMSPPIFPECFAVTPSVRGEETPADLASAGGTNAVAAASKRGSTSQRQRRSKSSAAEAGKQPSRPKQRVGSRRSLAAAELKERTTPEPALSRQSTGHDDALTAGMPSCSLTKPVVDAVSGSCSSQQVLKPPEAAAAPSDVVSPGSPASPPIFPVCFAVTPSVRGEETPAEADQQSCHSRQRNGAASSNCVAVVGPGPMQAARRGRHSVPRRSSSGLRRKQEPWVLNHPILTAVVVAAGCLLLLAVLVIVAVRNAREGRPRVGTCETAGCRKHGYDLSLTRDINASPCDDFYAHACGKWNRLYGQHIFDEIRIHAQRITYDELKESSSRAGSASAFFASCVDPKGRNTDAAVSRFAAWKRSLGLLWPEQRQTATAHPLDVLLCLALRWNVSPLFTVRIRADQRRPGCTIFLDRGTLNERHRRRKRTESFEEIVAAHCRVLKANTCTGNVAELKEAEDFLYGVVRKAESSHANPDQVWFQLREFEDHMTAVSGDLWYELLVKNLAGSSVHVYVNDTVVAHSGHLLSALDTLFAAYSRTPEKLLQGMAWLIIQRFLWAAAEMPSLRFSNAHSALLSKRAACIDLVDNRLGLRSAAGWLRRRFDATHRAALDVFLGVLVETLRDSLKGLSWIDEGSLQEALLKLSNLTFDVLPGDAFFGAEGVIDMFRDFDAAADNAGEEASFMGYFVRFSETLRGYLGSDRYEAVYRRRLEEADTRPAKYFYYTNSLRVSLAALEVPLYSTDGTYAMNYGGLGSYVARELSRVFDDVGTLVDYEGRPGAWWGSTKSAVYKEKLSCTFDRMSSGDTVGGDSSAEDGGDRRLQLLPHMPALETAYRAYKRAVATDLETNVDVLHLPNLEEYTDDQLFFLTYCHVLGAPKGDRNAQRLCNVPLRNFGSFAKAFRCPVGSPMNPKKKCTFFDSPIETEKARPHVTSAKYVRFANG